MCSFDYHRILSLILRGSVVDRSCLAQLCISYCRLVMKNFLSMSLLLLRSFIGFGGCLRVNSWDMTLLTLVILPLLPAGLQLLFNGIFLRKELSILITMAQSWHRRPLLVGALLEILQAPLWWFRG